MALLTPQAPGITGAALTYSAVTASDTVTPGNNVYYHVKTGGTNNAPLTVVVPGSVYGQARADVTVTVPISSDRIIGPLVADLADPTTGVVTISNSGTITGTTAAVLLLGA